MNAVLDRSENELLHREIDIEELHPLHDRHWEFIDGRVHKISMGARSARIGGVIFRLLANHVVEHSLGYLYPSDAQYRCFPFDEKRIRLPDISFISAGRFGREPEPDGFIEIAPDLVVEVVSPNDRAEEIEARRDDFFRVGTAQFWLVYPTTKIVYVIRHDGICRMCRESEPLDAAPLFPNFRPLVGDFFS